MNKKQRLDLRRAAHARLQQLRSAERLIERLTAEGRTFEEYLAETFPPPEGTDSWMDELAATLADLAIPDRPSTLPTASAESSKADWAAVRAMFDKAIARRDLRAIYAVKVA